MIGSLAYTDVNFVSLKLAVFCVECELLSENNTPLCLACGSKAVLSLSRILGGTIRRQPTAHLIEDAELDRLVRSLLHTVPQTVPAIGENQEESEVESIEAPFSNRHHMRLRHPGPAVVHRLGGVSDHHPRIDPGEIDLEPGISIIAACARL